MADEYRRFWITSRASIERERLLAEAFDAGAGGAEEVEEGDLFKACVYVPAAQADAIRALVAREADPATEIGEPESIDPVDWSEAWKEGIEALQISSRLVVRPPFVDVVLEPGQREVVIDPGQAFGTGNHASTRLCLDWFDAIYSEGKSAGADAGRGGDPAVASGVPNRVLDVGTGSGVLAFSCIVLGAREATGFDLDPVAIAAAQQSARDNGLDDRVRFFAGPIEELGEGEEPYPLVVANLLKREVLPIAPEVAAQVAVGGRLVLAGLLEEDGPEVIATFAAEGLERACADRAIEDSTGVWIGPCLSRRS